MRSATVEIIDLDHKELEALLEDARSQFSEERFKMLEALVRSYAYLTDLIDDKQTTIRHLRALLSRKSSEKTDEVLGESSASDSPLNDSGRSDTSQSERSRASDPEKDESGDSSPNKQKRKGHGRKGANDYTGASRVHVAHQSLKPGDPCPSCHQGKIYERNDPAVLVRITGQAPLAATVYELQQLRCNFCQVMFTAPAPEGIGEEKYDASAGAMAIILRYGSGVPLLRLEKLQQTMGIPFPSSTQWEIAQKAARKLAPVYEELVRQAALGAVLHNDDTSMRILDHIKENKKKAKEDGSKKKSRDRTGTFTSGIVSTTEDRRIALYFTGRDHAGENLADLLQRRLETSEPPIQMCDGSSRNTPDDAQVITANCLVHGRRHFVKIAESFPTECRYVLEQLGKVYEIDDEAKTTDLTPHDRLRLHQEKSAKIMAELETWMKGQIEGRRVEPNSGLGEAINYMLKRWDRLTLFLRRSGAPLDNNIVERSLKRAIVHRKNSLFYKSENGADVGDLFMAFIHTCELAKVDPFHYLTQLITHHATASRAPARWMPWNYEDSLATLPG